MLCFMALEIGRTAEGLLAHRAGIHSSRGRGWRLGSSRVRRRYERVCGEGAGTSKGACPVGDLGWGGEAGVVHVIQGRKRIIAVVVTIRAHSRQRIVAIMGADYAHV